MRSRVALYVKSVLLCRCAQRGGMIRSWSSWSLVAAKLTLGNLVDGVGVDCGGFIRQPCRLFAAGCRRWVTAPTVGGELGGEYHSRGEELRALVECRWRRRPG